MLRTLSLSENLAPKSLKNLSETSQNLSKSIRETARDIRDSVVKTGKTLFSRLQTFANTVENLETVLGLQNRLTLSLIDANIAGVIAKEALGTLANKAEQNIQKTVTAAARLRDRATQYIQKTTEDLTNSPLGEAINQKLLDYRIAAVLLTDSLKPIGNAIEKGLRDATTAATALVNRATQALTKEFSPHRLKMHTTRLALTIGLISTVTSYSLLFPQQAFASAQHEYSNTRTSPYNLSQCTLKPDASKGVGIGQNGEFTQSYFFDCRNQITEINFRRYANNAKPQYLAQGRTATSENNTPIQNLKATKVEQGQGIISATSEHTGVRNERGQKSDTVFFIGGRSGVIGLVRYDTGTNQWMISKPVNSPFGSLGGEEVWDPTTLALGAAVFTLEVPSPN